MNLDEVLKLRAARIHSFLKASGGGKSGVVPSGMAGFLLAVSASRIKALVAAGRLETIAQGGQRWILFLSVWEYAEAGEGQKPAVSKPDMTKLGMAGAGMTKSAMSKTGVSKPVISKSGMSKSGAAKKDMSKVGTI